MRDCHIFFPLQVTLSMEPQPQLQTELHTDDTHKNTKNNDENCSDTADSLASVDSQKNKGWYTRLGKTDQNSDIH